MSEDVIIGIDLGTTNSLVGVVDSGFPIVLADGEGRRMVASAVYFPEDGDVVVGEAALRARAVDGERVVTSVKRLMGRRAGEAGVELPGGRSPEEVSALILGELKRTAEAALGVEEVKRAVITVPAYFNDGQRNATVRAGELAGLKVERIVNVPTAAALAYGLDKLGEKSRVAVYDLGGGTFDISILELNEGVFQVMATHGDTALGGDDIDELLAGALGYGGDARVLAAAREAKERLSKEEEVEVRVPFVREGENLEKRVGRGELEELIGDLLERTRKHCVQVLADAGMEAGELDEVILVGGSTRIPAVRALVAGVFGKEPNLSQHPDEAVALGAAIQAGILSGALRNMVLLDVTPLSLGIETFGGLMNVIIPRNTTIPAKAGELFTNAVTDQESMLIRVLQGEREMARDNWELGKLEIPFEKGAKGSARVGVQFRIDENGILEVLCRDTATGEDTVLEIKEAAVDVDDERVEAMIEESVDHAFEDVTERQWTEARLKSEELLPAVEAALEMAGEGLGAAECEAIREAAREVRGALDAAERDVARLKKANAALDGATQELAALLVERALEEGI
ncbi:MAG: Hsp70 family protein [Verrucomicrobiota bacterium]